MLHRQNASFPHSILKFQFCTILVHSFFSYDLNCKLTELNFRTAISHFSGYFDFSFSVFLVCSLIWSTCSEYRPLIFKALKPARLLSTDLLLYIWWILGGGVKKTFLSRIIFSKNLFSFWFYLYELSTRLFDITSCTWIHICSIRSHTPIFLTPHTYEHVEKGKISYFGLACNLIRHLISPNQDDLSYSAWTFISGHQIL